jgi:hypothetical protein
MLKKIYFCLLFFVSSLQISIAQNYPAYNVNVCNPGSAGYYFLCTINGTHPTQVILDSLGRAIYSRAFLAGGGGDFKIQPNGLMSYSGINKFYLLDSTFTIVDSVKCKNGISTDGHDLQILPNGHFLLIGYENVVMNLSSYVMFGSNHTLAGSPSAVVKCGVIQEQDANHNVVFEWHAKDHYAFADVDESYLGSPANVDWNHMNAVELDDDGNILVSLRHFNEITKINRADSSIMWRLGGNANQFTFPNDPAEFKGQHDIRRIANGDITFWDNGSFGPPYHVGSAKEYSLNENTLTATLVWNYVESPTSYSTAIGNVQRLQSGNTLIDFGITPMENRVFDVVDSSGNKIFELQFNDTSRSYRVFNYPIMPWQFPRPQITCFTVGNQSYLDAGSGYGGYRWSTGATTQTIPIATADTFSVWVPIGAGGFIRSEFFIVSNPNAPCGPLGIENVNAENAFSIFPNPANDQVFIQSEFGENKKVLVELFDFTGKKIYSQENIPSGNQIIVPVADLAKGIYMVRVNGVGGKFLKM